ncbi:AMP-binding protein [Nocardioides cheoyonin]|uniref:AMP-binding protein n=1 Tax=Nocardioides cheoyonin TaxID=3156615 RepID=UPI0032B40592
MTETTGLYELWKQAAAASPDAVATIERRGRETITTTYAGLDAEIERVRRRLAVHGLGRGSRIGYWAENRREFLVWQLAAAAEGAMLVGINTRYRALEVAHVLTQARPDTVLMPTALLDLPMAELLHAAAKRAATDAAGWRPPQVALLRPSTGADVEADPAAYDLGAGTWWADEAVAEERPDHGAAGRPTDLAMAFTTSGSTGLPKLAAHDQASIGLHAREVARTVGYRAGDVIASVLPVTGVFSYIPTVAAVVSGAATLLVPVFEGAETIALMREHRVTHTFGGDDLYDGLHRGWQQHRLRLDDWRVAGVATFIGGVEPLLPWFAEWTGTTPSGAYGSSELFSLLSLRDKDEPDRPQWKGGGRLVSDALEVRAVDPGSGEVLPAGTVGLLQFRGYAVLEAYLRGSEQVPPSLDDGWFDSGDLGSVDADGRSLTYEGRAGEAMRLRGFLVQPAEIEHFLVDHPTVGQVKVVGASRGGREEAVAFVTPAEGRTPDPEELLARCRAELAPYKVPSTVLVLDALPVTAGTNGTKVRLGELRQRAQEVVDAR